MLGKTAKAWREFADMDAIGIAKLRNADISSTQRKGLQRMAETRIKEFFGPTANDVDKQVKQWIEANHKKIKIVKVHPSVPTSSRPRQAVATSIPRHTPAEWWAKIEYEDVE